VTGWEELIGYDNVGGCAKQMAVIQELVELPLRLPSVFETLGCEVSITCQSSSDAQMSLARFDLNRDVATASF